MLNYLFAVLFPGKPKEKKKGNLKNHKQIFSFTNNSVFATASADGVPNIVPIHSKHLVPGNKVLISDQFMNKTKHNILQNPYGTLLIRDSGQLYKINGKCKYRTSGLLYRMAVKGAKKYARKQAKNKSVTIKCKGIILMHVMNVEITAAD